MSSGASRSRSGRNGWAIPARKPDASLKPSVES